MEQPPPSRARLRRLARLREKKVRAQEGLILVEGPRLVAEGLAAGALSELFVEREAERARWAERTDLPVHLLEAGGIERLSEVRTPQGVVAIGPAPDPPAPKVLVAARDRLLVLEAVQDPGNAGTLARLAWGLGIQGVLFARGSADPLAPKVLRASAGALFYLPWARCEIEELGALCAPRGLRIVVPVVRGGRDLRETPPPQRFVLLASNEGRGTRVPHDHEAVLPLTIPMSGGCESLNVAAACAVILGRWMR